MTPPPPRTDPGSAADADDPDLDALLAFLHETRGVDFSGYKRPSVRRLLTRRMAVVGESDLRSYLDRLQVDPAEVRALFDSLLVNVTAFFRDPAAWAVLRDELLPGVLEQLAPDAPVRVWSAACATGEEAYSLAMVLHGLLGTQAYRDRVKIYATDLDARALDVARVGRYPRSALADVPAELVEEHFVSDGDSLLFRSDLRQNIIFGRHDLLADAPISRLTLLVCRNVLMYFTAETQARLLERFAFALDTPGLLFLGKAELLLTWSDAFAPLSVPHRVFRSTQRLAPPRLPVPARPGTQEGGARSIAYAAFTSSPDAQVVLDGDQRLVLVNESAVRLLDVSGDDVGLPFAQLQVSARPVDLRAVVARTVETGEPAQLRDVLWSRPDAPDTWWDVQVSRLRDRRSGDGVQVTFVDVSRSHQLAGELTRAHADLQTAYADLQRSNEELETTNEELQSAIEELETTNEELLSTNEELETMNEELQSTNEELQTVNDELRERTGEVGEVNALLESVLAGMRSGVAVVDRQGRVVVWNPRAERMWGLRRFEVEGTELARLDGGLPTGTLLDLVQGVLDARPGPSAEEVVLVNRFGQRVLCSVTGSPLRDARRELQGVILVMDEHPLDDAGPTRSGAGPG